MEEFGITPILLRPVRHNPIESFDPLILRTLLPFFCPDFLCVFRACIRCITSVCPFRGVSVLKPGPEPLFPVSTSISAPCMRNVFVPRQHSLQLPSPSEHTHATPASILHIRTPCYFPSRSFVSSLHHPSFHFASLFAQTRFQRSSSSLAILVRGPLLFNI